MRIIMDQKQKTKMWFEKNPICSIENQYTIVQKTTGAQKREKKTSQTQRFWGSNSVRHFNNNDKQPHEV